MTEFIGQGNYENNNYENKDKVQNSFSPLFLPYSYFLCSINCQNFPHRMTSHKFNVKRFYKRQPIPVYN